MTTPLPAAVVLSFRTDQHKSAEIRTNMTPIEPLTIAPQAKPSLRIVYIALIVAILASLPWAWMLYQERERTERLLTEKMAQKMKVSHVVIRFSNGIVDKLSTGAK